MSLKSLEKPFADVTTIDNEGKVAVCLDFKPIVVMESKSVTVRRNSHVMSVNLR